LLDRRRDANSSTYRSGARWRGLVPRHQRARDEDRRPVAEDRNRLGRDEAVAVAVLCGRGAVTPWCRHQCCCCSVLSRHCIVQSRCCRGTVSCSRGAVKILVQSPVEQNSSQYSLHDDFYL